MCVLDVVGLTPRLLDSGAAPHLAALAREGFSTPLAGVFPAVTCTAQATLLTGLAPSAHGVVGNGWFDRELGEVLFWRQSNRLVAGEKVYEAARALDVSFTSAKLFWWFNQGAAVDWSLTPKPHYGCDGGKALAIHGTPEGLARSAEDALGPFPFAAFWGPMAGLASSRWIARAAAQVMRARTPTLTLVYLPHLDYDLQRLGPDHPGTVDRLREVDECAGEVLGEARRLGAAVVALSEYGLSPVRRAVFLNRALREASWLAVRDGPYGEGLDVHASRAFAVVDHQVAHLYVREPPLRPEVAARVASLDGVERVLEGEALAAAGLAHGRSGDLVAVAAPDAWFCYPWWLDERRAPDYARTVDIHRKPGYDPCELFLDPGLAFPRLRVAWRLLQKSVGMRYRLDVVPLDASLVRGSHGRPPSDPLDGAVLACSERCHAGDGLAMTGVKALVLDLLGGG